MGGIGSGMWLRPNAKRTVEDLRRLGAHRVATELGTEEPRLSWWEWVRTRRGGAEKLDAQDNLLQNSPIHQNDGSEHTADRLANEYGVSRPTIERDAQFARAVDTVAKVAGELRYKYGGESVDPYTVYFTTTRPNYGGIRYFWLCPECGRRCVYLYGGRRFLCRECQDLTYRSSQTSGDVIRQANRKMIEIRRRLQADDVGAVMDPVPPRPKYMHYRTYFRLVQDYQYWLNLKLLDLTFFLNGQTLPDEAIEALDREDPVGMREILDEEIDGELHRAVRIKTAVTGKPATEVMREALRKWTASAGNGAGEDPKQAKE